MPTLTHLKKYRQLRSEIKTDSRGAKYLVLESIWRKWDATLHPLGWFVLYPDSAENTLSQLERFRETFDSRVGLDISRLPDGDRRETWQKGNRSGGLFTHREAAVDGNFAVVTFHPPRSTKSSAVWIHADDLACVIEFIREQLAAISRTSDSAEMPEISETPPPVPVKPTALTPASHENRPNKRVQLVGDFEERDDQSLEEMEDSWRERQELFSAYYDDAERNIEEGWPYPAEDEK